MGRTRLGIGCDRFNPTDAEVNNGLVKLILRPNSDHQIKLTGEFFDSDTSIDQLYDKGRLPGLMGLSSTNNISRLRDQKQTRYRLALEDDWDVHTPAIDNVTWRLSLSPQKRSLFDKRRYDNVRTNTGYLVNEHRDYTQNFYQADIQLTSSFDLANTLHKLTYGFQGDQTDADFYSRRTTDNLKTGQTNTVYGIGNNFAKPKQFAPTFICKTR